MKRIGKIPRGAAKAVVGALVWMTLTASGFATITIENRDVRLEIGEHGRVRSLVYKPTGEECLARGSEVPAFATVQYRGYAPPKVTPASSVLREGDCLIVRFAPLVTVAVIRLRITASYLGFTLEKVEGPGGYFQSKAWYSEFNEENQPFDELRFMQLPLRERGRFGSWLNVDWNDRLAVNLVATDPYAEIDAADRGPVRILRAGMWPAVRTEPVGAALIVTPPEDLLTHLARLEKDYGLPRGAESRLAPATRESYWEVGDPLTPANVGRMIAYAKCEGVRQIQVYWRAFAESGGHFPWRVEYPHGMRDLHDAVAQLAAAGITAGVHIHFNKAGTNDSYVTPVPDPRLNLRQHFTLAAAVDAHAGRLSVFENPLNVTLDKGRRILRFGNELISFRSYTTSPPYEFLGCNRGALGTTPAPHLAGLIGGLLDVDNWPSWIRFNQRTDIQDEVARRLAAIYRGAGFRFVYFDGSEDVPPPYWFNIANAQWRVYRDLQPEPLFCEASNLSHFDWHMMSLSTAEDAAKPGHIKALVRERRLHDAAERALNFTRCDFGWLHLAPPGPHTMGIQPDMIEYVESRGAAWGCPTSITATLQDLDANPRTADNLEVIRRWETVRTSGWLTAAQREALKKPDPEYTLLVDEKGRFELVACHQIAVGPTAGTVRAFLFNRRGDVYVVFWDTQGRSRLTVPLSPSADVARFRQLGDPLPIERSAGSVVLQVEDRQYLDVAGLSPTVVEAAFRKAIEEPGAMSR